MAKVLFIIYNQKSVVRLLKDLQEMANESKIFYNDSNFSESRLRHYESVEIRLNRTALLYKYNNEAEMISRSFIGMLGIASVIFVGGPAMAIFYRKFQGTYVAHQYGHPYKGL